MTDVAFLVIAITLVFIAVQMKVLTATLVRIEPLLKGWLEQQK